MTDSISEGIYIASRRVQATECCQHAMFVLIRVFKMHTIYFCWRTIWTIALGDIYRRVPRTITKYWLCQWTYCFII